MKSNGKLVLCFCAAAAACAADESDAPPSRASADAGPTSAGGADAGGTNRAASDTGAQPSSDVAAVDASTWIPADLPPWVPAPGQIANVSLNTMADVNPCPPSTSCTWSDVEHQQGMFAWVGGTYTPGVGSWGVLSHWGGGHNAYSGNEVYVFDFDTRMWERKKDPYPANSDTPYNEWAEFNGVLGEPVPPHTYRQFFGLPPQWGGGPRGSSVQLSFAAIARAAGGSTGSQIYDHATGKWSRYANTLCPVHIGYKPAVFDTKRGKFYALHHSNGEIGTAIVTLDATTRDWSLRGDIGVGPPSGFTDAGYTVADYLPTLDQIVAIEKTTGGASPASPVIWTLDVPKLVSGAPVAWTKASANAYSLPPLATAHSMNFAPLLGKFGIYFVGLGNVVVYLKPPAVADGQWEWSQETFGGDAPLPADGVVLDAAYNRFNWIEPLRSWAWYTRVNLPVQLWRPAGT